jgi:hypothetical protein
MHKIFSATGKKDAEPGLRKVAMQLLNFFDPIPDVDGWIDYNHFAELWLVILLPALDGVRNERPKRKWTVTLGDLKVHQVNLDIKVLNEMLENCRYASTLDEVIVS